MYQTDCIAAIATPTGTGGVAVIRISGGRCFEVTDRVFRADCGKGAELRSARMMYCGEIVGDGFTDRGMCVTFRAPHSYTGEDTAELHCHGGVQIAQGVLRAVLSAGARLAENGEFTKRAFLNGKLDLTSCEGVADMIHARSAAETRTAYRLMEGELYGKIKAAQDRLTDVISYLEVMLDYPEEDIPDVKRSELEAELRGIGIGLKALSDTYGRGSKLKTGIKVAICGRTNAGKSSLLNRLLGEERAIVTEIEGTTRDLVEGELELGGMRMLLQDTAGLRESADRVEKIGIERSKRAAADADLVLYVRDVAGSEEENLEIPAECPVLTVWNKSDLSKLDVMKPGQGGEESRSAASVRNLGEITLSAKTGEGVEELRRRLEEFAAACSAGDAFVLTNERHYRALLRAQDELEHALEDFSVKPCDLLALDLRECWDILGEVTGVTATEDIIDRIFSKFCLGK